MSSSVASAVSTGRRERAGPVRQAVRVPRSAGRVPPRCTARVHATPRGSSTWYCSTDIVRQSKAIACHHGRRAEDPSQVGGRNRRQRRVGPHHQRPADRYLNSIPAPGIEAKRCRWRGCSRSFGQGRSSIGSQIRGLTSVPRYRVRVLVWPRSRRPTGTANPSEIAMSTASVPIHSPAPEPDGPIASPCIPTNTLGGWRTSVRGCSPIWSGWSGPSRPGCGCSWPPTPTPRRSGRCWSASRDAAAGVTLAEIEELLDLSEHRRGTGELHQRAQAKVAELDARIDQLTQMRQALLAVLVADCDSLTDCSCGLGCPLPVLEISGPGGTNGDHD